MRKRYLIAFFTFLLPVLGTAQNPLWTKIFRAVPNDCSVSSSDVRGTTHYTTGSYSGYFNWNSFSSISAGGKDIFIQAAGVSITYGGLQDDSASCLIVD